jgi:hypothetical protein
VSVSALYEEQIEGYRLPKIELSYKSVRFHVLTAASMKFRVFWDILSCSKIDVDLFSGIYSRVVKSMSTFFWDIGLLPCSQIDVEVDIDFTTR